MKESKQRIVMACLATGRYSYKDGEVYSEKFNGKIRLKGCNLPGGYTQIQVSNHRRGDRLMKAIVYKHIFIYMMHYGEYPEGMQIDHIDRNPSNDRIENLRVVTAKENSENRSFEAAAMQHGGVSNFNCIRHWEIQVIRKMHAEGASSVAIAKAVNANRASVSRAIKKIESGEPFKHEYPTGQNKQLHV